MRPCCQRFALAAVATISLVSLDGARVAAGGPSALVAPDRPVRWANDGLGVGFNPDAGMLGPLDNAQAVAMTEAAFTRWQDIPSATATFADNGVLPVDVDATNFAAIVSNYFDGVHPIVFDDDGAILEVMFGPYSGVLGVTAVQWRQDTGEILDANVILTGRPFGLMPTAQLLFEVAQHEFGHFAGLDHSVVNGLLFNGLDTSGPTPHETFPRPAQISLEVMYVFQFIEFRDGLVDTVPGQDVLQRDDIAAFSAMYPEPSFPATTGTIEGRIVAPDGITPLAGVNVIARNVDNPFEDAVSFISGGLAGNMSPDNPLAGAYRLSGLTPGGRYAVYVDQLPFNASFGVSPSRLPGPEEFFNGAGESSDPVADDPAVFVPVVASGGAVAGGTDIVFNRRLPGPIRPPDLVTGSVQLFPPFPIDVCGQRFESLWLNINGTITFGMADPLPFGSAAALLEGPPRLSALWTNLNPFVDHDTISFEQTADTFMVRFMDIGEWDGGGSNTFAMTLAPAGTGRLTWRATYGNVDALGGVAGYTCGAPLTSGFERESDLTAFPGLRIDQSSQAAVFEEFAEADNDLDNVTLTFVLPLLQDRFEPNNSIAAARQIALPFATIDAFSQIGADDVDFYRFKAKAGDILAVQTLPGPAFDTLLGLFRVAPNGSDAALVAVDDPASPFSRILYAVPADGEYALAVSAFPDVTFEGANEKTGRYVLYVAAYRGTALPLGDDESIELALPFTFPYQGNGWTSVWVNSDGNLTFGQGDSASTARSLRRFRNGPPRIAPLFADLDTTGVETGITGVILAEAHEDAVSIHWIGVPNFLGTTTNTFTAILRSDGEIQMTWGPLSREFGSIVGITQGGGALVSFADLSESRNLPASGTTCELFFGVDLPIDLAFRALKFVVP